MIWKRAGLPLARWGAGGGGLTGPASCRFGPSKFLMARRGGGGGETDTPRAGPPLQKRGGGVFCDVQSGKGCWKGPRFPWERASQIPTHPLPIQALGGEGGGSLRKAPVPVQGGARQRPRGAREGPRDPARDPWRDPLRPGNPSRWDLSEWARFPGGRGGDPLPPEPDQPSLSGKVGGLPSHWFGERVGGGRF